MPRDIVNFLPNIRADLGEMRTVQRNSRSDGRASLLQLIRSGAATDADKRRILKGFTVAQNGVPDSNAVVTRGSAMAGVTQPDGTVEYGVLYGAEGPATILVDFAAKAIALYAVYVRLAEVPGTVGTRIFWNDATEEEEAVSVDTRLVLTWEATAVLNASPSPGDDWIKVATVDWDGAAVVTADITDVRVLFFEGDADGSYVHEWGDGANDRNADRATYPISDLWTWVHMLRRQIEEIVGLESLQRYYEVPFTSLWEHEQVTGNHTDLSVMFTARISELLAGLEGINPILTASPIGGSGGGPRVLIDANGPPFTLGASFDVLGTVSYNTGTITFGAASVLSFLTGAGATFATGTQVDFASGAVLDMNSGSTLDATAANVTVTPSLVDFSATKNVFDITGGWAMVGMAANTGGDNAVRASSGSKHWLELSGPGATNTIMVPIKGFLNGTVLDSVIVSGNRQVVGSTASATVYYVDRETGDFTSLGSDSFGAGTGDKIATIGSLAHVMDTTQNAYYVAIAIANDGGGGTGDIRLYGTRARGNVDALFPA